MEKILKRGDFTITQNINFPGVITACSFVKRPGQDATWITGDMIAAYTTLHCLGYAHSSEAWLDGRLVGGCYGLLINNVFCGESMFTIVPNAAKAAFLTLAQQLFNVQGVRFIDCQVPTDHLCSLGGVVLNRAEFLELLYGAFAEEKHEN